MTVISSVISGMMLMVLERHDHVDCGPRTQHVEHSDPRRLLDP